MAGEPVRDLFDPPPRIPAPAPVGRWLREDEEPRKSARAAYARLMGYYPPTDEERAQIQAKRAERL